MALNPPNTNPDPRAGTVVESLRRALESERAALVDNDAEALARTAADKMACLRTAGSLFERHAEAFAAHAGELRALAELNLANGLLIARRRRETQWTLHQLGLGGRDDVYDASGSLAAPAKGRRTVAA